MPKFFVRRLRSPGTLPGAVGLPTRYYAPWCK
jgi:hypothetical protein